MKKTIIRYAMSHGSKAWYLNHINDIYVKKATELNYRSRASFKLLQLLKTHPTLIKSPTSSYPTFISSILDLGCAPGSWSQVLRELMPGTTSIVGIDLLSVRPIKGVDLYQCDARSTELHRMLESKYGKFGFIVSDMAPNFDGDKGNTHCQMLELNCLCVQLCFQLGKPSCNLVMKSVQGEKQKNFYNCLTAVFKSVYRQKPSSSRSGSMEFFYVCQELISVNAGQNAKLVNYFNNLSLNVQLQMPKHAKVKDSQKILQSLMEDSK